MKKIGLIIMGIMLIQLSVLAEPILVYNSWNTDLSSVGTIPTEVSGTGGTSASVSYHQDIEDDQLWRAGGVYTSFDSVSLGTNEGDSVTLTFTVSVTDTNGAAYDLDRRLFFGLAGPSTKLHAGVDTGAAYGGSTSRENFGYDFSSSYLTAGLFFRAYGTLDSAYTGTFNLGAGVNADTIYTMSLIRQADGSAVYSLSQVKTDNNWQSTPVAFTKEQADAIELDKVFFGQYGGIDSPELIFSITNLSIDVNPVPYTFATISSSWNTDLSGVGAVPTNVSGSGGTVVSVSYHQDMEDAQSWRAGGVYSSFDSVSLGSAEGDSITLTFTASVADTNGAAYDLDRRLFFGLAGPSTKLHAGVDTGVAYGSAIYRENFGHDLSSDYLSAGYFFRAFGTLNSVYTGTFNLGADADANTVYTMSLTRQADGSAIYSLSQAKTDNNWDSTPFTFTKEQADAITLDKVFFGQYGGYDSPELIFSLTEISLRIVATPDTAAGYEKWALQWGGTNVIGTATNDYDGDGLINLYEYALGGNPTNALDQGTSPQYGIVEQGGTAYFGYVYPQLTNTDSGLTYSLETCTNLVSGTWTNAGYTVLGTNLVGGMNMVSNYTDTVDSQKFIRLMISTNTPAN